jgi:hypothetical protein
MFFSGSGAPFRRRSSRPPRVHQVYRQATSMSTWPSLLAADCTAGQVSGLLWYQQGGAGVMWSLVFYVPVRPPSFARQALVDVAYRMAMTAEALTTCASAQLGSVDVDNGQMVDRVHLDLG